jgi:hypothetical protein
VIPACCRKRFIFYKAETLRHCPRRFETPS